MEAANGRCASCGEPLPDSSSTCASCGADVHRVARPTKGVFLILILLLIVGFVITGTIARGFEARQQQLAERWFARGNRDLQRGAPAQAVDEFQTALAYARDNDAFRLRLALALMQAGREDEARVHLVNLWEARPGDANVNLQLARVMARLGHSQDAIRYYHGAIYGVWDAESLAKRQAARFELARYLLSTRQANAAESELIALADETPSAPQEQIQLADMLMEAGDPWRALGTYLRVPKGQHDAVANLGAARAAFAMSRLGDARQYARDALRIDPKLTEASSIEAESDSLLKADPLAGNLSTRDRAERAMAAYGAASERAKACAGVSSDSTVQQLFEAQQSQFKGLSAPGLQQNPDLLQEAVQWVYRVEKATAGPCGAPTGLDATLLTLARMKGTS